MRRLFGSLVVACLSCVNATAQLDLIHHGRPILDAHNCYPYEGRYADRIDRALSTGFPVGIEQDLGWYVDPKTGVGRTVVTHGGKLAGTEPSLRDHFFERVRPLVEKALKENDRSNWPLIVLHFDFKDDAPGNLAAVWKLLGEFEGWITTARKGEDPSAMAPFDVKPLLVLTEERDAHEQVFYQQVPVGEKLRIFGSAKTVIPGMENMSPRQRAAAAVALPPEKLLPLPATNYRRWWNNGWALVEEGGQKQAGAWTEADAARLKALVDHAHRQGYWIRFYTLDGFAPGEDKGWGSTYNFGSRQAAEERWNAVVDAGVNLIATDQYEDFAAFLHARRSR